MLDQNKANLMIIAIIIIATLPSAFRFYNIKDVYFDPYARNKVLESYDMFNKDYGYSAADLLLQKTEKTGGTLSLYFSHCYKNIKVDCEKKIFQVEYTGDIRTVNEL
jgi:hypothetical protein